MVEVIFGVITACCNGYTTASAFTVSAIGPRLAAVTCTATLGSGSFFVLPQPVKSKPQLARTGTAKGKLATPFREFGKRDFMAWPLLLSMFGGPRGPRGNARLRLDTRRSPGRRWSARRRPPAR